MSDAVLQEIVRRIVKIEKDLEKHNSISIPISTGGSGSIIGATNLDDLTDVIISAAVSGQLLIHNGTLWANANKNTIKLDDLGVPSDSFNLNVTTTYHGLVPKAPNDINKFLRGDATWAIPPAGGTGGDSSLALDVDGTAEVVLSMRDVVYFREVTQKWNKVDTSIVSSNLRGVVVEAGGIAQNEVGKIRVYGTVGGYSDLEIGVYVYVGATPGQLTQIRQEPEKNGAKIMITIMGVAVSATDIYLYPNIIYYIKREEVLSGDSLSITHHKDEKLNLRFAAAYLNTVNGIEELLEELPIHPEVEYTKITVDGGAFSDTVFDETIDGRYFSTYGRYLHLDCWDFLDTDYSSVLNTQDEAAICIKYDSELGGYQEVTTSFKNLYFGQLDITAMVCLA